MRILQIAALFAAPALAQNPPIHQGELLEYPWPTSAGTGAFGRAVAGELTGDHLRDVVVLRGNTPGVVHAPRVFGAIEELALKANDLDVLPGAAPGGWDALATVGVNGLKVTSFDPATGAWTSAVLGLAPYTNGRALRTGDVDGDGGSDIVLLDALGQTLHILRATPGGQRLRPLATLPLAVPALDIELLDWDADGDLEIALLDHVGLTVLSRRGAPVATFSGHPGDALAVLHRPNGDRLAWVTKAPGPSSSQVLRVVGENTDETPIDFSPQLHVVSASSFDLEGDGDEDLLLGHKSDHLELLLLNREHGAGATQGTTFSLLDPWVILLPVISSAASVIGNDLNEARPVFLDFDDDGDADLLFPVESVPQVTLFVNPAIDLRGARPKVAKAKAPFVGPLTDFHLTLELRGPSDFDLSGPAPVKIPATQGSGALLVPPAGTVADGPPPQPTHVQFLMWRQGDLASSVVPMGVLNEVHPLPASWPQGFQFVLEETNPKFVAVYHMVLRFLAVEGQAIESVWPPTVGSLTADPGGLVAIEFEGNGPTIPFEPTDDPPPPPPTQTGGFVPRAFLPILFQPPTTPPPTFVGAGAGAD